VKILKYQFDGVSPLIMHNGRLADPGDFYAQAIKEISSKRKKVEADYAEMGRLEFLGGLYLAKNGEPCIPAKVIQAALTGKGGAARKQRMGKEAAVGCFVYGDFSLVYDGPKTPDELWKNKDFVSRELMVVGQARIMRVRPIFEDWSATVEVHVDTDYLDIDIVKNWVLVAGQSVGLMDSRPRYGRFSVTEL
jgi:hypothetical protein